MNVTVIITAKAPAHRWRLAWMACVVSSLTACSGGIGTSSTSGAGAVSQYTVGGTVSGLTGSGLVLDNNGTDDITVSGDGAFTFAIPLVPGDSYSISVRNQPTSPSQTCTVSNGSGTVTGSNITSLTVACVNKTSTNDVIGGTVEGLLGSGLVLQNNFGDNLAVGANGGFVFATQLVAGATYSVSVLSPPINPYQNCEVANGGGTVGANDVLNVAVTCKSNPNPTFSISGTVSGLSAGSTIVLQNNGRDDQKITANVGFHFTIPIPTGSGYSVTSSGATGQQSQACAITNASGTVAGANVANVTVNCIPNTSVTATVSGLAAGATLVLQNNGADDLTVTQNGLVTFPTAVAIGSTYAVTVATQPVNQTCSVKNGGGMTQVGTPTNVLVTCGPATYTVGGTVSGLAGTGLVLLDNGGNNLNVTANGPFTFSSPIVTGGTYSVTVFTQPTALTQSCTVASGSGPITAANITTVAITCTTIAFTVSGTVSGLTINPATGAYPPGLVLQNNAGANLTITNTPTFAYSVLSGAPYNVTIVSEPSGYACAVANGVGVVTAAAVSGVAVSCSSLGGLLYVTNGGGNNISGFAIDYNAGTLQPLTQVVAAAGQPNAIVATTGISPTSIVSGRVLCRATNEPSFYVASPGSGTIAGYAVNTNFAAAGGGALTTTTVPPVTAGTTPTYLNFFAANPLCALFALNTGSRNISEFTAASSGALTPSAGSPVDDVANSVPAAAAHATLFNTTPASTFEYVANQGTNDVSEYSVSAAGTLTFVPNPAGTIAKTITAGMKPSAIATDVLSVTGNGVISAAPFVYVANQVSNSISAYQGDPLTGILAPLGTVTTGNGPTAMIRPIFDLLYVTNGLDNTLSAYSITTSSTTNTGTLTAIGTPIATGTNPVALTYANVNLTPYLYVVNAQSNDVYVYSINLTTGGAQPYGALTFVAKYPVGSAPTSIEIPYSLSGG